MTPTTPLLAFTCLLVPSVAWAGPDEDFAERAGHPDVVFFEAFDTVQSVEAKHHPDGSAEFCTFSDEQAASGNGSMQFEIPSNSAANSSGSWKTNFADDNYSIKFRSGDEVYIQWRQRFTADFLDTVFETTDGGSGGWKQIHIGEGDYEGWNYGDAGEASSCSRLEIVVNNGGQRAFPQMYHSCGDYWPYSEYFASEFNGSDFLLQNAVFDEAGSNDAERYVLWSQQPARVNSVPDTFPGMGYYADEWMTFQVMVAPGPLGSAVDPLIGAERSGFTDSTVSMWVARDGEPALLTHHFEGVVLQRDAGAEDTDEAYGKVWLTTYHTNKDPTHSHPVGFTWFDELIVSRSRIADPGFPSTGGGSDDDGAADGSDSTDDGADDMDPADGGADGSTVGGAADGGATTDQGTGSTGDGTGQDTNASDGEDDSGCSCRAGGGRSGTAPMFLLAFLGLLARRRRRQALVGLAVVATPLQASAHPYEDLAPGQWLEVDNNTIADLDPCPQNTCSYSATEGVSAVIDDWNGGAFATGFGPWGGLVVFGGGHGGYFGNELYVFDVALEQWVRHTEPVDNPICDQSTGELQDGSPCSAHTYNYLGYHPGSNAFVELGSASNHEVGGGGSPYVHVFDFDDDTWRRGPGDISNFISHTGASCAYDENRDIFWVIPAYFSSRLAYDPNANAGEGSWTQYPPYNIDIDATSVVHPDRDLLVTIDGRGTNTVIVHDLANFEAEGITVSLDGTSPLMTAAGPGLDWDAEQRTLVGWQGGTSVWELRAPEGDWATEAWTWVEHPPARDNTASPTPPNMNNTYGRWRYMSTVNAYIVVNGVDEPVYIYKMSEGPGVGPGDPGDDGGDPDDDDDGGGGGGGGAPDDSTTSVGTSASPQTDGVNEDSSTGADDDGTSDSAGADDVDSGCSIVGGRDRPLGLAFIVLLMLARRRSQAARTGEPRGPSGTDRRRRSVVERRDMSPSTANLKAQTNLEQRLPCRGQDTLLDSHLHSGNRQLNPSSRPYRKSIGEPHGKVADRRDHADRRHASWIGPCDQRAATKSETGAPPRGRPRPPQRVRPQRRQSDAVLLARARNLRGQG